MADSKPAETEKVAEPPKRNSKKVALIVALLSLVIGLGAGAGVFFLTGNEDGEGAAAESAEDAEEEGAKSANAASDKKKSNDADKNKDKGEKGKKKAPKAPAVYVKLEPFVVNFEAQGVVRYLQITMEVMTRDPELQALIEAHDPAIRNDLLFLFGNQQYESLSTREGKEKLRQDALEVVRKVITAEGGKGQRIEAILFTSFVMQ